MKTALLTHIRSHSSRDGLDLAELTLAMRSFSAGQNAVAQALEELRAAGQVKQVEQEGREVWREANERQGGLW